MVVAGVTIGAVGILIFPAADNQYKRAYILMIPVAPIAGLGFYTMYSDISVHRYRIVGISVIFILLLPAPIMGIWAGHVQSGLFENGEYSFEDQRVVFKEQSQFDQALFDWIQRLTPPDSALIFHRLMYERLGYGVSITEMIFAAAAQRSLFYGGYALPEYLYYDKEDREKLFIHD